MSVASKWRRQNKALSVGGAIRSLRFDFRGAAETMKMQQKGHFVVWTASESLSPNHHALRWPTPAGELGKRSLTRVSIQTPWLCELIYVHRDGPHEARLFELRNIIAILIT